MRIGLLRRCGVALVTIVATAGFATPAVAATSGLNGTIVDSLTNAPVVADVVLQATDGSYWNQTDSDSSGHYDFPDAPAGDYQIQVLANGYVSFSEQVTAPGTTDISLPPIQYGGIGGHVVSSTGSPVKNVNVQLMDTNGNDVSWTATDKSGAYHFTNIQTGSYIEDFTYPNGQAVYYVDGTDQYSATQFAVTANATSTIDMTEGPTGTLVVKILDANTGLPVDGGCIYYQGGPLQFSTCAGADGKAKLKDFPVGTYQAGVSGPGLLNGDVTATIAAGTTTTKTVRLKTGGTIHFNVIDATTGDPIDGSYMCGEMVLPSQHGDPGYPPCGGLTDMSDVWPSTFTMFVAPNDGIHGAQWVGANGGTGDPDAAQTFTITYNQHLDITIKLDGEGSIAGVVTSAATGNPLSGVCPIATPPGPTYSPAFDTTGCTYTDGVYNLSGLGPYTWKVAFPEYSGAYAWGWSGGGTNRANATSVQVVAGETVTENGTLSPSGHISGTVSVPDGECLQCVSVYAINTATGDYAGVDPYVAPDGTFTMGGFDTGNVKLYYTLNGDTTYKYPTTIHVIAGQTVSGITLTIPAS